MYIISRTKAISEEPESAGSAISKIAAAAVLVQKDYFSLVLKYKRTCAILVRAQKGLNTMKPKIVFFLGPTKPLPSYD